MKYTQKLRQIRGFTLVELMIVIAVLAILAGISVVGYGAWRESVAKKEVQTDLQTVATAMLSARNFNDSYPTSIPSNFSPSPNVQLTYITGSGTGYCVEAVSKTNSNVKYYISSNGKTPVVGTCGGIVLADESGSGGSTCNAGDTLSGSTCTHTYTATYQGGSYSCPSGGTLSGTTCTSTYSAYYSSGGGYYGCPSGGTLSGTTCTSTTTYPASNDWCSPPLTPAGPGTCYNPNTNSYESSNSSYACTSGGTLSGTTCTKTTTYTATYYSSGGYYYCSGSDTLSGTTCTHTYTATAGGGSYTCPSGGTLSGSTCTQTYPAT